MKFRRSRTGIVALPAALVLAGLSVPSAASGGTPTQAAQAKAADSRPNIVLILADDLGWSDVSTDRTNLGYKSGFNETPTLERLASEGMAFTDAYSSPTCTPGRSALLSGQYAPRKTNNIYLHTRPSGRLVNAPQGLNGEMALPNATVTMAETLQSAGYATGYIGKFHVTRNASAITAAGGHGFDVNVGGNQEGKPYRSYHAAGGRFDSYIGAGLDAYAGNYTRAYVDRNIKPFARNTNTAAMNALVGTSKHLTDAVTDATVNFMKGHASSPFFAFMGQYAPHEPVQGQGRKDLVDKYKKKAPVPGEPSNPDYGALIEGLDQSIARVVHYLESTTDPRDTSKKLADNTLLVVTSDNGGAEYRGAYNGPLRGQKAELREGGIRVPTLAWSKNPALVDRGTTNATPISNIDFYPTFAALAGATVPAHYPLDGLDLRGILVDPTVRLGRDSLFWHVPRYFVVPPTGRDQRPQSAIRSGNWKLVYSYEAGAWRLYDLATDIGETTNLAQDRPQIVKHLGIKLMRWLDGMNAPLATVRGNLNLTVSGYTYANGRITAHQANEIIRLKAGDEMPLIAGF